MRFLITTISVLFFTTILFGQTISNVTPNSGNKGTFQLPIVITGSGTNFSNATSTVVRISQATSTILDLEVTNINSVTPTSVSCNVRIPFNAVSGNYTVSVYDQNVGGMVNMPNGFTVSSSNPLPTLVKTTPKKVSLNQTLPITITVDNANFSQATDNTILLSYNGTSTLINPVSGTTVGLNDSHIRATFDLSGTGLTVGSFLNSHCGNSFDGYFTDYYAIEITESTSISGSINYSGSYNGVVELYQLNSGSSTTYSLVASSPVISNTYTFNNIAEDSYLIRSVPIGMTDVVATYYSADISWQTATLVTTNPTLPGTYDITPVTSLSLPGGITVNGTLGYGPNGFNKSNIVLAEGVEVFLKDITNNLCAQTVTDQNGEYSFNNIPNGDYEIVIDLPGFSQISTYSFSVTGSSSDLNGLDFLIDDGLIFKSNFLGLDVQNITKLTIYPNPTSGTLTIQLPSNLTNARLSIVNTIGQIVYEENVFGASKTITTDITSLNDGIYIVRLEGDQFTSETRLVKTK